MPLIRDKSQTNKQTNNSQKKTTTYGRPTQTQTHNYLETTPRKQPVCVLASGKMQVWAINY